MPPQTNRTGKSESSEVDLLTQILKVLQSSTIAEERGQDTFSRFWAAYKKVSSEYDGDMLETCNGNMDIVLIFAGLFSAVNTAFIVAMQPNPVDTTNALLVQLIQDSLYRSSAVQTAALSASNEFSANFWPQALAYASLALSLLAAFGAVLGKQWLGYYKTHCYGRGSLEDRCKQRHRKFQTVQKWHFQSALQSFPLLLQMSLLLFGVSLGAWMWTQQRAISILIFVMTGFGFLFYVFTIVVSVTYPDCPFQTPVSLAIQAILRYFRASEVPQSPILQSPDVDSAASAMQWISETSTHPDIISSVVELLPVIPNRPDMNVMPTYGQIQDIFKACFARNGLVIIPDHALAYGHALTHLAWKNPDAMETLRDSRLKWNIWESWRSLYFPWALEQCLISYNRMKGTVNVDTRNHHQADTRTALRMAVTTGIDGFTHPDDERLVWHGQFQLHSSEPIDKRGTDSIDQLMQCVGYFYHIGDLDVAGDALLLATRMAITLWQNPQNSRNQSFMSHWQDWQDQQDLQDQQEQTKNNICSRIITFLNTTHRSSIYIRLRCIALSAAEQILGSRYPGADKSSLRAATLMAVCPPPYSTIRNAGDKDEFQFTNAIRLLHFTKWPEGNDLELSLLPEIQHLVLRILPIPHIDDEVKYSPYYEAVIRMMGTDNPSAVRHSALHIACGDRRNLILAAPGNAELPRNMVLSKLSPALLAITKDNSIPEDALIDYLGLIAALASSPDWLHRLMTDGHVERCIKLIDDVHDRDVARFNLAAFFLRVAFPGEEPSRRVNITREQWWFLLEAAWCLNGVAWLNDEEIITKIIDIRALVKATLTYIPRDLSKNDWKSLNDRLQWLIKLDPEQTDTLSATVTSLMEIINNWLSE